MEIQTLRKNQDGVFEAEGSEMSEDEIQTGQAEAEESDQVQLSTSTSSPVHCGVRPCS